MKKILFVVALAISTATFAQKEEMKVLKKIYEKDTPSTKDLENYKTNLSSLESKATEEGDKVYVNFYKGMLPLLELANLGQNVKPEDQMKIFNPSNLDNFASGISQTLEYEKRTGNKLYTEDINETLSWFKPMLSQVAFQLNTSGKFKEASILFYSLFKIDKSEGTNLENAAILAVQSGDYKLAEKLYDEYKNSDYLNNGVVYYAMSKATDKEESFPNRDARVKAIALGTHEKPRDEKVSLKKPEVYKMVALIASHNGNTDKAKKNIEEALALSPNDTDLKTEGFRIYFNQGYDMLKDDQKLVDEINANRDNKAKYDELMAKRKEVFKNALPSFEKAYALNPTDANTLALLNMTYDILSIKKQISSKNEIKMIKKGGVYELPCKVNGVDMNFIFDTGASSVSISLAEATFLLKQNKISPDDFIGVQKYTIANGQIEEGYVIRIKEFEFGGYKINNIEASVVKNLQAPLLLGQNVLQKFGKITIDNNKEVLIISK